MSNIPQAGFDEDIPGTGFKSDFVQLSKKGDRIRFRIFAKPFYIGKHWLTDQEAVNCPRINSKDDKVVCEYCQKFEEGIANPNHRSGTYKPNLQFYYPIIDRDLHAAAIFQTSVSVHMAIKEAADAGIDVYKSDWQVTRNEGSPANYYGVVRLEADQLPAITDAERKSAIELKDLVAKVQASMEAKVSTMEPKVKTVKSEENLDIDEISDELDKEIAEEPKAKSAEVPKKAEVKETTKAEDDDDLLGDLPF